jgi:hypothetical protein
MREPEPIAGADSPQQRIEAWRRDGASRVDPPRFRYLEALSLRLAQQPEPVRRVLHDKLQAAVAEYAQRVAQRQAAGGEGARRQRAASCAPLAELNRYIRNAAAHAPTAGDAHREQELASVGRFRQAWTTGRAQEQLEQAVARRPANAGPINSHALVLQSLALMGELSADYLRRFLVHVESLQWLEAASEQHLQPAGKPPSEAKAAKPRRGGVRQKR